MAVDRLIQDVHRYAKAERFGIGNMALFGHLKTTLATVKKDRCFIVNSEASFAQPFGVAATATN